MDISVVVPVYGCKAALWELYRRLCESLSTITNSFEIILVEDNCPQNSWEEIEKICKQDNRVKGIHFSRNFGQICAITAGLDSSVGLWIVVMDCDLQDRPEEIPALYNKAQEGYDVVFARRVGRKDSAVTKFLSRAFYKVYGYFTDSDCDNAISNFSISKREVIDNYCKMREHSRAYRMFIQWLGYKQTSIEIPSDERFEGKSSYSFRKKLKLSLQVITSQSNKPLIFVIKCGFMIALLAGLVVLYLVIRHAIDPDVAIGWTSTMASIYLMGGITLCAIGVVGIYIGNIFDEVKQRPLYVIKEKINFIEEKK